ARCAESKSAKRHCIDEQQGLFPRVLLGQPGIRYMVKGETKAASVREAVIELGAAAKLPPGAEIETASTVPVPACEGRGHNPARAKIHVEPETDIAVERTGAGAHEAGKRRKNPQHIANPVLALQLGPAPGADFLLVGGNVENAGAGTDARRIRGQSQRGEGAQRDLRRDGRG